MNKVYVVNHTMQNLDTAKKFGQLKYITEGNIPLFKTDLMIHNLKEALIHFKENDYLLIVGPAWLSIIAASMLFSKYSRLKFLIFDAKLQRYIVRHLDIDAYKLL